MDRGQSIATALLACSDDDLLPMLDAATRPVGGEPHYAARGRHGNDGRNPELDGFLDREFHAIGGRESLDQRHGKRRLALDASTFADVREDCAAIDAGKPRRIFATFAVEQNHCVTFLEAQHPHRVMRHGGRQRDLTA